jgi:hypothetical protein
MPALDVEGGRAGSPIMDTKPSLADAWRKLGWAKQIYAALRSEIELSNNVDHIESVLRQIVILASTFSMSTIFRPLIRLGA